MKTLSSLFSGFFGKTRRRPENIGRKRRKKIFQFRRDGPVGTELKNVFSESHDNLLATGGHRVRRRKETREMAGLTTALIVGGAVAAATAGAAVYSSNAASKASDEANRAQMAAAEKIAKAQADAAAQAKRAQDAAVAAKPATAKAVSSTGGSSIENRRLRGIQATLMASRSAQNAGDSGKATLGE